VARRPTSKSRQPTHLGELGEHEVMSDRDGRSARTDDDARATVGGASSRRDAPRPESPGVVARVASAIGDASDYVEGAAAAVGAVVDAAARRLAERPGARVRRVRRLGRDPLPYLYDVHPDARRRTPRELGVRIIDVAEIAGTAVGPPGQRGGDFLPMKAFRSRNWAARWQRLGRAADRLAILPPIDVLRYDDTYWVVDGHNRVGLALYLGQPSIDADVTELVDRSRPRTEPPEPRAAVSRVAGADRHPDRDERA
jgi:hypothetical protein